MSNIYTRQNLYLNMGVTGHSVPLFYSPYSSSIYSGNTSSQGPQGATGSNGITGFQGPQGFQGVPGLDIGVTGPQGVIGPQGIMGFDGVTGSQGPQGFQGIPGLDVGVTGPLGPQGVTGSDGVTGPQGVIGLQGPQGFQGIPGLDVGVTGPIGPQGFQGHKGSDGVTGPQGIPGTGSSGESYWQINTNYNLNEGIYYNNDISIVPNIPTDANNYITITSSTTGITLPQAQLSSGGNYIYYEFTDNAQYSIKFNYGLTDVKYIGVGPGGSGGNAFVNSSQASGGGGGGSGAYIVSESNSVIQNSVWTINLSSGSTILNILSQSIQLNAGENGLNADGVQATILGGTGGTTNYSTANTGINGLPAYQMIYGQENTYYTVYSIGGNGGGSESQIVSFDGTTIQYLIAGTIVNQSSSGSQYDWTSTVGIKGGGGPGGGGYETFVTPTGDITIVPPLSGGSGYFLIYFPVFNSNANFYVNALTGSISTTGSITTTGQINTTGPINTSSITTTGSISSNQNINATGNLNVGGIVTATNFNALSDSRIKMNILSLNETEYGIDNLRPVMYKNILTNKMDFGLIAEELKEEYPFLVTETETDNKYYGINYNGLISLVIKENQILKKRLNKLENILTNKNII